MATPDQLDTVRQNTDEPTEETFSDVLLSALIDAEGVDGASATVWERKAGAAAKLVNTSEGGASRSLSDISKAATGMAQMYRSKVAAAATQGGHPRTRAIIR